MFKGVIIQASSRSTGNTSKIVNELKLQSGFDVVDLNLLQIGHYDYDYKNRDDDFQPLFKDIVTNYKTIIFVTPIYWYSMSGLLKVFFDRISDFLNDETDYGRKLRGFKMLSVSISNDNRFYDGFEMPFKNSANYLGMTYKGHLHTWVKNNSVSEEVQLNIKTFIKQALN